MANDLSSVHLLLLKGRIAEALTEDGLQAATLTFAYLAGGVPVPIATQVIIKPSGYYGVVLRSADGLPAPAGDADLILRMTATLPDGRSQSAELALAGADLAASEVALAQISPDVTVPVLGNAPFTLDLIFAPRPVTLQGSVHLGNDPATPAVAASVTLDGLSAVTDARGNFRLTPLPLAETLPLTINVAGADHDFTLRPDFRSRVNFRTFAI